MEYVCTGAVMKCTMGTSTAKLKATPKSVSLVGKDQANIADFVSMVNVPGFGRCRSLAYPPTAAATAANHGHLTPMPCVPGTCPFWSAVDRNSLVCGQPALLKAATLKCAFGGTISIVSPGQNKEVKAGGMNAEEWENIYSKIYSLCKDLCVPEVLENLLSIIFPIIGIRQVIISPELSSLCIDLGIPELLMEYIPLPIIAPLADAWISLRHFDRAHIKSMDEFEHLHKQTFQLLMAKNPDGTTKLDVESLEKYYQRLQAASSLKDNYDSTGRDKLVQWRIDIKKTIIYESFTYGLAKSPNGQKKYSNGRNSYAIGYIIKDKKKRKDWELRVEAALSVEDFIRVGTLIKEVLENPEGSQQRDLLEWLAENPYGNRASYSRWEKDKRAKIIEAYKAIQHDIYNDIMQ